jgi:hypothetical protein
MAAMAAATASAVNVRMDFIDTSLQLIIPATLKRGNLPKPNFKVVVCSTFPSLI